MTLNIMKLQKKTIWVLKISNKKPLFHVKVERIMNRNRHLRYKPIIETRPFLGGIGVSARCPKCKSVIQMQQSKCKCGCSIMWDNEC